MGTMLFANGLMFGDPPEVWNLSKPDIVRRIHRGYIDAGSQIIATNTFGGNRMRLSLHGLQDRVAEINQTAAILVRSEVEAAGGDALVAGDIGPTGASSRRLARSTTTRRSTSSPSRRRRFVAGGVDLALGRDDVRPGRDQGRDRGSPAGVTRDRADRDDDVRHSRPR